MFRLSRNFISKNPCLTTASRMNINKTVIPSANINAVNFQNNNLMNSNKKPCLFFSTTNTTRYSHGQNDHELVHSLEKEVKYEKEAIETEAQEPNEFLTEFKKQNTFQIVDTPGEKEIKLVRQFGNEKITVLFSTDALADAEDQQLMDQEEGEENDANDKQATYPVNLTVLIEKPGDRGTMELSVIVEDDSFFIENVAFNQDSKLMSDDSAEADWKRRGVYGGPVFDELDETLQDRFHQFLEERGFDHALADFIPNYIEHKEQKEYMRWLDNVAKFVAK